MKKQCNKCEEWKELPIDEDICDDCKNNTLEKIYWDHIHKPGPPGGSQPGLPAAAAQSTAAHSAIVAGAKGGIALGVKGVVVSALVLVHVAVASFVVYGLAHAAKSTPTPTPTPIAILAQTPTVSVPTPTSPTPKATTVSTPTQTVTSTPTPASTPSPTPTPSPTTIPTPCTLTVNQPPLQFTMQEGGNNPAAQNITASTANNCKGNVVTSVKTTDGRNWLTASQGTIDGTTPLKSSVAATTQGMTHGTYTGTVDMSLVDASGNVLAKAQQVKVTLTITAPTCTLNVSQTQLTFNAQEKGSDPAAQSITASTANNCTGNVVTNVTTTDGGKWLTASGGPIDGATPLKSSVAATTQGMTHGTYTGTVDMSLVDASGNVLAKAQQVKITLTITTPTPTCTLNVSQTQLTFNTQEKGSDPAAQSITASTASNCKGNVVTNVTTTDGGKWLTASGGPIDGATPLTSSVAVTTQGMTHGTYTGTVDMSLVDASGNVLVKAQQVTVTLNIKQLVCNPNNIPSVFNFNAEEGSDPPPQSFTRTNNCGGTITITSSVSTNDGGNWLSVTDVGQVAQGGQFTATVSVHSQRMVAGVYHGKVVFTVQESGSSAALTVNLTIIAPTPTTGVTPTPTPSSTPSPTPTPGVTPKPTPTP